MLNKSHDTDNEHDTCIETDTENYSSPCVGSLQSGRINKKFMFDKL
jgi:hypothetical protein